MTRRHVLAGGALAVLILAVACPDTHLLPTGPSPNIAVQETGRVSASSGRESVIVGAGDIANCDT
jgi:hypothetical protein